MRDGLCGISLGCLLNCRRQQRLAGPWENGTAEVDTVLNVGHFIAGDIDYCERDISTVGGAAKNHPVKVILERCVFNDKQIASACECAVEAEASFVKTSAGFSAGGDYEGHTGRMLGMPQIDGDECAQRHEACGH